MEGVPGKFTKNVYMVSLRQAKATQWDLVKNKFSKKEREKENMLDKMNRKFDNA